MTDFRYQVKWTDKSGAVHYGIYQRPYKGKAGYSEVDDAVMPYYHVAPTKDLVDIEPKMGHYDFKLGANAEVLIGGDEYHQFVNQKYVEAKKLSDSLGEGILVGKLFSVGVADGSAWYVVTKVGKSTAKVEWRGFCPDRYTDQVIGIGGSFPLATLKRMGVGHKSLFA